MTEHSPLSAGAVRAAWIILGLALVFRVAALPAALSRSLYGDEVVYRILASNLRVHGEYYFDFLPRASETMRTRALRVPGYPLLLFAAERIAGAYGGRVLVLILQIVLSALMAYVCVLLGTQLFSSQVGVVAGILVAVAGNLVGRSTTLYAETVAMAMAVFGTYLLVRCVLGTPRLSLTLAILGGLCFGLGGLFRPEVLGLGLLASGWVGHMGAAYRRAAVLALVMLVLCVCPWVLRNYSVLGACELTTEWGGAFWSANNDLAEGKSRWDRLPMTAPQFVRMDEVQRNRAWFQEGIRFLVTRPARNLVRLGIRRIWYWASDAPEPVWRKIWVFLLPFSAAGVLFAAFERNGRVIAAPVCLGVLIALMFGGHARFRDIFQPYLSLCATLGVVRIIGWCRRQGIRGNGLPPVKPD